MEILLLLNGLAMLRVYLDVNAFDEWMEHS